MEKTRLLGVGLKPLVVVALILILGTAALHLQGYFKQEIDVNPAFYSTLKMKVALEEGKYMLIANAPKQGVTGYERIAGYPTLIGSAVPEIDSLVMGFDEAKEMTVKKNLTTSDILWGYNLDSFFGKSIRITGILKKTETPADMMHFVSERKFNELPAGQQIEVKLTGERMPKLFYIIDSKRSNWPEGIKFASGNRDEFKSKVADQSIAKINIGSFSLQINENKTYLPLVLGSKEAEMMIEEKIFSKTGDKIENFFGKDVIVAGILEPTDSILDMLHYMPEN